jgi:periplasmic divalent cation tolerance protein
MKKTQQVVTVLVTAPEMKTARKLAQAALKERLVACVNLLPGVESHYWWKGTLERGKEVLMIFKTRAGQTTRLEKLIVANHPYDTPEFVVVPVAAANERYLKWWLTQTARDFF